MAVKMQVRRLDRFIIFSLLKATVVGAVVAVIVLMALQLLRLSGLMVRHSLEFSTILKMMWGLGQSFTPIVIPIAFLFATLIVFGRMSTDREFVAMQAMGYSPKRVLLPCLVMGIIAMIATAWVSFDFGPRGNRQFEISMDEAFKSRVESVLRSGTFSEGFLDMVVFVDTVDPKTFELRKIFIYDESNFKDPVHISAKSGRWIQNKEEGFGVLQLKNGVIVSFGGNELNPTMQRVSFQEYRLNADFSKVVGWSRESPPSLGLKGLLEKRQENLDDRTRDPKPIWLEMARRIAICVFCLLLVPLVLALSIDTNRTAKSRAVGYGLLILFGYWTVYFAFFSMILKSTKPIYSEAEWLVHLIIWIPNILIAILGMFFFKKRLGFN